MMNPRLTILVGVALGVVFAQIITFFLSSKGKRADDPLLDRLQESNAAIAQQTGMLLDRMDALEQKMGPKILQTLMITATRCLQRADECLEALRPLCQERRRLSIPTTFTTRGFDGVVRRLVTARLSRRMREGGWARRTGKAWPRSRQN